MVRVDRTASMQNSNGSFRQSLIRNGKKLVFEQDLCLGRRHFAMVESWDSERRRNKRRHVCTGQECTAGLLFSLPIYIEPPRYL